MKLNLYKKHTEIYEALTELISERLSNQQMLLPPEIELAKQLETSRMTLRKAMLTAEINGLIRRENKKTLIIDNTPNLRNCGRILFITTGIHSSLHQPSMERLWLKLSNEIRVSGGDISLLLLAPPPCKDLESEAVKLREALAKADIIILTISDAALFSQGKATELIREHSQGKTVFSLAAATSELAANHIMMDNRQAGIMAAELLYHAGAKKPLCAACYPDPVFQLSRAEAFAARYRELSQSSPGLLVNQTPNASMFSLKLSSRLPELFEKGHDGIFLVSDECCDIILVELFERGLIPNKFKVVTVNGSGLSLRHKPPLTCLSHGTDSVTSEMLAVLKLIANGNAVFPVRKMIKPRIYYNQTL